MILSTGNEEIDSRLGGGIPHPSLIAVEGDNGSGKTSIALLLAQTYLRAGLSVVYFTNEGGSYTFVNKAKESGFDLFDYFLRGSLRVYTMNVGVPVTRNTAEKLLGALSYIFTSGRLGFDAAVIDTLSYLSSAAPESSIKMLFEALRKSADRGMSVVVTFHPNTLPKALSEPIKATCDGYIKLSEASLGGRRLKVLTIVKLKGLPSGAQSSITFDVDPAFGIKVIPIVLS
ncbi:Archaeal flagellar like-protein H [Acidilobus saccharovorans 345-15]|uniref:Archaeal flagellar like-protein H n=1 Tax=Acidilobus saccharovorans (strain DSM 16705 / JCM 18335 / VKM B-2471 / 345-15) TaxID=666510 RepID=D9PZ82_ACIS3|nr:ATPase domain-containing protein [Acidilobus saccharovorans]ADL19869.1 Archaeal flagellar like-protein H [Acidilobus saccharovorans 345-15]